MPTVVMVRLDVTRVGWAWTAFDAGGHAIVSWGARRVDDYGFVEFGTPPPGAAEMTENVKPQDLAQALLKSEAKAA